MSPDVNAELDAWWKKNEAAYSSDACHMSEYHMVSVVWEAAAKAERAKMKELLRHAINEADEWHDECCGGPIKGDPKMDEARGMCDERD